MSVQPETLFELRQCNFESRAVETNLFYFFEFFIALRQRQNEGNFARNSGDHENLAFVLVLHPNALESNKEIKFSHSMFVDLFS